MNIISKFLTVNPYSRSGRKLAVCKALIFHYVGIPNQRALSVWNYFEIDCPRNRHYSSAHYIIDNNGDIYHTVPDDEVAYHCGSSVPDPVSGRIYTDWARKKLGMYADDPTKNSPNNCTIGIELCIDQKGDFTENTLSAAVELTVKLLNKNNLNPDDIGHHKKVVGWKDCPLPWVKDDALFQDFKAQVRNKLGLLL